MKTMDAAHGKWGLIYNYYGISITGLKHIDCPLCEGKKKFRIDDKYGNGDWFCTCTGSANGIKLLQGILGLSFGELAKQIDAITGNSYKNDQPVQPIELSQVQKSINKFKSAEACRNTPAQLFFNNRTLFDLPQGGVKYIASEPYRHEGGKVENMPAIYTIASNLFGEPIKEHITYITNEGLKADVPSVRKIRSVLEYDAECSVKLFQATDILGVGEGIETCLAAYSLYKIPTWATLNTTIMKKFKAPKGVKTLYIFADNDENGAGLAAAFECGHKNILNKNDVTKVVVRWPLNRGDFNNVVIDGGNVTEMLLNKKGY